MQLAQDGKVVLGDEVFDFTGDAVDVHVPVDQVIVIVLIAFVAAAAAAAAAAVKMHDLFSWRQTL